MTGHHRRLPAIRALEAVPVQQDGETLLVLNDRQGVAPEPIVVRPALVPFLQLFDGEHTLLDLQSALTRATRQIVTAEEADGLVDQLDQALVLDSDRFRREQRRIIEEFRGGVARQPTHAVFWFGEVTLHSKDVEHGSPLTQIGARRSVEGASDDTPSSNAYLKRQVAQTCGTNSTCPLP